MAGLSKPPGFGTNSWDESTWAAAQAAQLPRFRVADADAWKPSVTGADRTVSIAVGGGWACGVWDPTDAAETKKFDPNTGSTDRYDLLVARYNWATDTRTFEIITGTTSPPAVNTTQVLDSTKVNRIPGARYDGAIAVLRVRPGVGAFATTDLFDCRVWGGVAGPLRAATAAYVNLMDGGPGAQLAIGARQWEQTPAQTWTELTLEQALGVNAGWSARANHRPRGQLVGPDQVRLLGWFRNNGASTIDTTQLPVQVVNATSLPLPVTDQVMLVPFNASGVFGLVVGTFLATGVLRLDKVLVGPATIPAAADFFLDGLTYDINYTGA